MSPARDPHTNTVTDPFQDRDLPLGLRHLSPTPERPKTVRLESGIVVFFTDGLVECGRNFVEGERALEEVIARNDVRDAPDPALAIRNAMPCDVVQDDVAILVARLT